LDKLKRAVEIVHRHKAMMLDNESYSIVVAKSLVEELEDVLVEETPDDSTRHGLPGRHVDQSEP
jgi:hemoglobin-like flavoprotein